MPSNIIHRHADKVKSDFVKIIQSSLLFILLSVCFNVLNARCFEKLRSLKKTFLVFFETNLETNVAGASINYVL